MPRSISLHKSSLKGIREANEDTHTYFLNLDSTTKEYAPVDIFVICDGHGGPEVSEFVIRQSILLNRLKDRRIKYPLSQKVIEKLFNNVQQEIIQKGIAKSTGSTCLIVVRFVSDQKKESFQIINLGDCRAVLSRDGVAMALTKDHKPHWPDERKRIDEVRKISERKETIYQDHGDWRIGDLSVSRSFGDLDNTPYVTHLPESFTYGIEEKDEFLVIACDGLYDILQNHDIVNFVKCYRFDTDAVGLIYSIPGYEPYQYYRDEINIARKLGEFAIAAGSEDNVSIMILFFD